MKREPRRRLVPPFLRPGGLPGIPRGLRRGRDRRDEAGLRPLQRKPAWLSARQDPLSFRSDLCGSVFNTINLAILKMALKHCP